MSLARRRTPPESPRVPCGQCSGSWKRRPFSMSMTRRSELVAKSGAPAVRGQERPVLPGGEPAPTSGEGSVLGRLLLLRFPHLQVVFTFPRVLRVFSRHDHGLVGDGSRLACRMMQGVCSAAAGRKMQGAAVIADASAGDFVRRCSGPPNGWNPHLRGIFLEGGFDRQGHAGLDPERLSPEGACCHHRPARGPPDPPATDQHRCPGACKSPRPW